MKLCFQKCLPDKLYLKSEHKTPKASKERYDMIGTWGNSKKF